MMTPGRIKLVPRRVLELQHEYAEIHREVLSGDASLERLDDLQTREHRIIAELSKFGFDPYGKIGR